MIFDSRGLPRDNGATDLQDSARLAGIMATFGIGNIPLEMYVVNGKYVRHPDEVIYDFSRDQAICLMAGLAKQFKYSLVNQDYVTGLDVFLPSAKGHIARCKGGKASYLQDAWLWLDILWACYKAPDHEVNQLVCILALAPPKYLAYFKAHHPKWRENILEYWGGWRGEKALGEAIITKLEAM